MTDGANANALVGTWRLVSCALHDGDRANHLYGTHPIGFLTYTSDGHMSVMFGDPNRPLLENPDWRENTDGDVAATARTFIAYCGTYALRDSEVSHQQAFSLTPNWIGRTLTRRVVLDGNTLVLATPEMLVDGRTQTATLTWQRVESEEPRARPSHQRKESNVESLYIGRIGS
jgi:hypothetical protein